MGTRHDIAEALEMAGQHLARAAKLLRETESDDAKILWTDGVRRAAKMMGYRSVDKAKPLVGRWLKHAGGDCVTVLEIIGKAEARGLGKDCVGWIESYLKVPEKIETDSVLRVWESKVWKVRRCIRNPGGAPISNDDLARMVAEELVTPEQARAYGWVDVRGDSRLAG